MAKKEATQTVIVVNHGGVHLRAATLLVSLARQFESTISVTKGSLTVDGKSTPLQLLALGADQGEKLAIKAIGEDADEAVDALVDLFAAHFEELSEDDPEEVGQGRSPDEGTTENGTNG